MGVAIQLLAAAPAVVWCGEGNEGKTTELETITVTANKMEENIKDVPQSVSVIDAGEIEEKGIRDIGDVVLEIPNMTFYADHGARVNFRGLNSSTFTNNNPVVIYIDGIPQSNAYGFDASLANVERVEVLRGPQGTLYGKDAIGGVINIVTKEPTNKWAGNLGAEYGSDNYLYGTLNLNGPLVADKLWGGINIQGRQDDGWITNTYPGMEADANEERDNKINAFLLLKPTSRLSARLTVNRDYVNENWMDGYGLPGGPEVSAASRDDAEQVSFEGPTWAKTLTNSQGLTVKYDFDAVLFESITTHKTVEEESLYDADFNDNPAMAGLIQFGDMENETWTQEIRLSSQSKSGLRWVGGLYFDSESNDQGPYGMQTSMYGTAFDLNCLSETDATTGAVFGQVMIPFADRFELTLGGRYQHIAKEIDLDFYYLPVGMSGSPMYELNDKTTWDIFLPKVALSYAINDVWTAYSMVSMGYMPGGYNYFAMTGTAEDNSFEPQKSVNYEVGLKASFNKLYLAASAFYMDIEDIHIYKTLGPGIYVTDNADKAHSLGVELEARYSLTDTIELTGALGLIDTEYDDYDAGAVQYDGEDIDRTPTHTLRLGVAYTHPGGFYSRFDLRNQGKMYFYDDANTKMDKVDGYTVADAKIGYRWDNWDLYAYVKNLTDKEYVDTFKSMSTVSVATFGDPRFFGVGVRYSF